MKQATIFTPQVAGVNPLVAQYAKGDILNIQTNDGLQWTGVVEGFPSNSVNDTDFRMRVFPADRTWCGNITISLENNYYGQYHISECKIEKI